MAATDKGDPDHWRQRAAEMRALATVMEFDETQQVMNRLADDYDKLADRAEARSNDGMSA